MERTEAYFWGKGGRFVTQVQSEHKTIKTAVRINAFLGLHLSQCCISKTAAFLLSHKGHVYTWGLTFGVSSTAHLSVEARIPLHSSVHFSPPSKLSCFSLNNILIRQIACGDGHALFLSTSNQLFTLGDNTVGQLGVDPTLVSKSSSPVLPFSTSSGVTVHKCFAHFSSSAIITQTPNFGSLYGWGANDFNKLGQLSLLHSHYIYTPSEIVFKREKVQVTDFAFGSHHSIACALDGRAFGWGYNSNGETGHPISRNHTVDTSSNPKEIKFSTSDLDEKIDIKAVACGGQHSLFLTTQGKLYACGHGSQGQLGVGKVITYTDSPQLVKFTQKVIMIACGVSHSVAVTEDGSIFTWGTNTKHQLGLPSKLKANKLSPSQMHYFSKDEARVVSIAAFRYFNLIILEYATKLGIDNFPGNYNRINAYYQVEKRIKIRVCTWNINGQLSYDRIILDDWLRVDQFLPDIYAIGFQEVIPLKANALVEDVSGKKELKAVNYWKRTFDHYFAKSRTKYYWAYSKQLFGIWICIYVSERLYSSIKNIGHDKGTEGGMKHIGNKGAVAVRFDLQMRYNDKDFKVGLCFINTHLKAGEKKAAQRNESFRAIMTKLRFKNQNYTEKDSDEKNTVYDNDIIIFFGDLNVRTQNSNRNWVKTQIEQNNLKELLQFDELAISRQNGDAFQGFVEGPINFAPTYKYDPNSILYSTDPDKLRIPSWCDRVLYRYHRVSANLAEIQLTTQSYNRHEYNQSDHRPVSCTIDAALTFIVPNSSPNIILRNNSSPNTINNANSNNYNVTVISNNSNNNTNNNNGPPLPPSPHVDRFHLAKTFNNKIVNNNLIKTYQIESRIIQEEQTTKVPELSFSNISSPRNDLGRQLSATPPPVPRRPHATAQFLLTQSQKHNERGYVDYDNNHHHHLHHNPNETRQRAGTVDNISGENGNSWGMTSLPFRPATKKEEKNHENFRK